MRNTAFSANRRISLHMRRISVVGLMLVVVSSMSVAVVAADSGPIQDPLNDHFYEAVFVPGGIAWQDAKTAAESRLVGDVAGHLATFASAEEFDFVVANLPEAFISPVEPPQNPYLLGGFQPPGTPNEPDGGWQWVTGEPFVYFNWGPGEPNDAGPGAEDCLHIAVGAPQWNDLPCEEHARGYVVEYDVSGVFADDESSIFEADIEWLADEGITAGCNPPANYLFCPDDNVTRGQMATFLTRALGLIPSDDDGPFTDHVGSVHRRNINALRIAGITTGCAPDMFCPGNNVTRAQMGTFLTNALGLTPSDDDGLFTDHVGSVHRRNINALRISGITAGCNPPDNTNYCPADPVKRRQMAAFLRRALG